jgi:hypothetical protein
MYIPHNQGRTASHTIRRFFVSRPEQSKRPRRRAAVQHVDARGRVCYAMGTTARLRRWFFEAPDGCASRGFLFATISV